MPITRALSARHNASQSTQVQSTDAHTLSSNFFENPIKSKPFCRTTSMPTISIDVLSTWTETGNMNHASTPCQPAKSISSTGRSLRSSSMTTMSLCSFSTRKSGGNGSDDEDEGDRRASRSNRGRLGGCYPSSEQGDLRNDNNKENIAPLRRLSKRDLRYELAAQQAESTVRRTRTLAAVPMSDRSDSVSGSSRTFSRRLGFRRTVSTPVTTTTRKRSRSIFDGLEESVEGMTRGESNLDIPSASSRPRLEANSLSCNNEDDFGSVLNSSQATPMSEIFSLMGSEDNMSSPISRCTTPEPSEMGDAEEKIDLNSIEEDTNKLSSSNVRYANVFSHARALLSYGSGAEVHIVGRDRERSAVQRFMQQRFGLFAHLERSAMPKGDGLCSEIDGVLNGGSLYVCGLPGTGKTALIRSLLADIQQSQESINEAERLQVAFIDCMTIQNPRELFKRVLEALHGEIDSLPSGEAGDVEAEKRVAAMMKDESKQTLIVLDEIDHLLRTRVHQNILYRLFSWPQKEARACALIGIANSLDLTERFVPLLASKGAAPAVLNFRPFEAEEIKNVIRSRLALLQSSYGADEKEQEDELLSEEQFAEKDDSILSLFQPAAFELVARKIAAATGDLRKALDASKLAVELVEQETLRKALQDSEFKLSDLTPTNAPKITPAHILKVVSTVLGSPQLNKIRGLALQPKLILLALLIAQKRSGLNLKVLSAGGMAEVNRSMMGVCSSKSYGGGTLMCEVESTYAAMLKNDDFPVLESSELIDVMEGLEVEGIVKITNINGTSTSTSNNSSPIKRIGNVSPSAKRAAKRQLLASYRRMELTMSIDEILKGITTPPPMSQQSQSSFGSIPNTILIESIKRIWQREDRNAERAKGWEKMSEEAQRVRDEELGGGRGAVGI